MIEIVILIINVIASRLRNAYLSRTPCPISLGVLVPLLADTYKITLKIIFIAMPNNVCYFIVNSSLGIRVMFYA